jgi:hypothetical protein
VLDWLLDNVTVILPTVIRINPARAMTLIATASSSLGTISQYRSDVGDGTPIVATTSSTVQHRFQRTRSTALVEVTDTPGHRALASTVGQRHPVASVLGESGLSSATDAIEVLWATKRSDYFGSTRAASKPRARAALGELANGRVVQVDTQSGSGW